MTTNVSVTVRPESTDIEQNAARLLRERLEEVSASTSIQIELRLGPPGEVYEIGDEGFAISNDDATVVIKAKTPIGFLFGAGKVLRDCVVAGRWSPPSRKMLSTPVLPVRAIYFAAHMGNWYSHATLEETKEYLDEMVLWGYNELTTVLEVRSDETFNEAWPRLKALEDHARSLGMRVSRIAQSNTPFNKPRDEWKATPGPIPGSWDVCPSQPGAREFLVEDKREFFSVMQPYDSMILWPYDGGGCFSESCRPWAKTFLDLSREIAERAVGDDGDVRVSAWFFERDVPGEDDVLFSYLEHKPTWFSEIIAGSAETRRWKDSNRTIPDGYKILLFPDISMFDGIPWGGRGANAAPYKFAAELRDVLSMLSGGVVYSEGRYDDANKVLWAQMLWDPGRDPADIMREYARVYFGDSRAGDLLVDIEEGMASLPDPERWRRGIFHPEWDDAARAIADDLHTDALSWRWRLIRAKTRIEALVTQVCAGDQRSLQELRTVYDELQSELNRHDERSLPTWIYAPVEEAVPCAAALTQTQIGDS